MKLYQKVLAAIAMAIPASSFATTINLSSALDYKTSRHYSADGINLTISGYTGGYNSNIRSTVVGSYGAYGLGAEYASSPDHAIDNANSNFDMLLFTFDQAVSLDTTSIGWWNRDSDLTVLAYTGTGNAASTFANKTWGQAITSDSWNGAHFIDVAQHGGTAASNPLGLASTSWLVGTFLEPVDKLFQRVGQAIGGHFGADYVKLKSVSFSQPKMVPPKQVPEMDAGQAGIALALMAGLVAWRRERRRVNTTI